MFEHVCVCILRSLSIYIYMNTQAFTYNNVYIQRDVNCKDHTDTHVHPHAHLHKHTYAHTYTYVRTYVCMCLGMILNVHACICQEINKHEHIYIYMYIHTYVLNYWFMVEFTGCSLCS